MKSQYEEGIGASFDLAGVCEGAWEGPSSRRNPVCVVVLSSNGFIYSTFRGVPWLETRRRSGWK